MSNAVLNCHHKSPFNKSSDPPEFLDNWLIQQGFTLYTHGELASMRIAEACFPNRIIQAPKFLDNCTIHLDNCRCIMYVRCIQINH